MYYYAGIPPIGNVQDPLPSNPPAADTAGITTHTSPQPTSQPASSSSRPLQPQADKRKKTHPSDKVFAKFPVPAKETVLGRSS